MKNYGKIMRILYEADRCRHGVLGVSYPLESPERSGGPREDTRRERDESTIRELSDGLTPRSLRKGGSYPPRTRTPWAYRCFIMTTPHIFSINICRITRIYKF